MLRKFIFVLLFLLNANIAFAQWQTVSSGVTENLVDGCFVTDSIGFIISSNGVILKTVDAGNTWIQNITLQGVFTSICSVGTDTIYAGGNSIYRSDNGGTSWNLISNLSFTITDLGFFGSQVGFAIVPYYTSCQWSGGTSTYDYFQVYKSVDSGSTWQLDFGNVEKTSHFQFINDSTAYVTGGATNIIVHCAGPWYNNSKRTNDRGNTWIPVLQPNYGHSYFSFISEDTGYFVQPYNTFSIYKTTDGGNSLVASYTEIYDNSIKQCKFINEIDGYLLGRNDVYVTSSNGFYWSNDFSTTDSLNCLFNTPANLLFGVGSNGLIIKKEIIASSYSDTIYRITLDNNSMDFGFVNVDSSFTKTINITNTGSVPLNLSLTSLNDFKISFTNGSFQNNLNATLNTFQDTTIFIQFSPLQAQQYMDTLLITADSLSAVSVPLSGFGYYGISGNILQDTLICVDTLRVGGNLTIKSTAKMTICAGTYVKIMGNFKVTVEGLLEAIGDSINTIDFGVNDTSALWSGIYFNSPILIDTSRLDYCNFLVDCNLPQIDISKGIVNINHSNFSNRKNDAVSMFKLSSQSKCVLLISNSKLYNNKAVAIGCNNCDSSYVTNCDIYGNTNGILFSSGSGIFISENNIYNNLQEGIYGFGRLTIQKNKIFNNGGGIYVSGSGIRIENNEIYNNMSTFTGGISAGVHDGGAYINQNLIFNNSTVLGNGAGLKLAPSNGFYLPAYVTNNTICNNQVGVNGIGNNFYATTNTSSGLDIKLFNNIIYNVADSNSNIGWFPYVTHEIKYNCINQDSINIWGQNNNDSHPKFVNPTDSIGVMSNIGAYDWSLQQSSPCINKGDSLNTFYLLPFDFAGNTRIYNNRVDIGSFEFQGDFVEEVDSSDNGSDTTSYPIDTIYSISLFPNPTNNILNITVNTKNFSEFVLYDAAGRLIFRKVFIEITMIDVYNLPKGIYLYELRDINGIIKKGKFVRI